MSKYSRLCVALVTLIATAAASGQESPIKPLDVPYQRQEDSALCQSAAVSMFLKHVAGKTVPQTEIKASLIKLGGQFLHSTRIKYLQSVLPDAQFEFRYLADKDEAWKEIRTLLQNNIPVILSTKLTNSGHVIVVVGASVEDGNRMLVVHDPFGHFDFEKKKFDRTKGEKVAYPFDEMIIRNRTVQGTIDGKKVEFNESYNVGQKAWTNDKRREKMKDIVVVKEKAEWAFIRCVLPKK